MSAPAALPWFARHELNLAWRDWTAMMTAGQRRRGRTVAMWLIVVAALAHLFAYGVLVSVFERGAGASIKLFVVLTGMALLSWTLMLSQAMESVTRAFYARADLDLILSSPAPPRPVFTIRIAVIAATTIMMAIMIAGPFVNVMVALDGARWLAAYGVMIAMGAAAAAVAVGGTVALFRLCGPRRTRLIAQIVAALVGATFVIGLQAASIVFYGNLSRLGFLNSAILHGLAPGLDSLLWWPARAAMGEPLPLVAVLVAGLLMLAAATLIFAPRFGAYAVDAIAAAETRAAPARSAKGFRAASPKRALRRKEWLLLRRDPWLLSQTLMQILYLLPPALLLWRSLGTHAHAGAIIAPVVVMASGQLAGGLAWLTISGEDAPDLVASAPVPRRTVTLAKVEAVLGAVAMVVTPIVLALALLSLHVCVVTALSVIAATGSSTIIQFWFRAQADRNQFRRRQTSSRVATFAEAFSSVSWAATAGLAAIGTWLALGGVIMASLVLAVAFMLSPRRTSPV